MILGCNLSCLVFNAGRVILSSVQVLAPMVLKLRPIPMLTEIGYSLRRGRGGSLDCICGVCKHSGPPVFLVPFRKDLANQKWLPALGIEPASLDHESQPLTIGPFLTFTCKLESWFWSMARNGFTTQRRAVMGATFTLLLKGQLLFIFEVVFRYWCMLKPLDGQTFLTKGGINHIFLNWQLGIILARL